MHLGAVGEGGAAVFRAFDVRGCDVGDPRVFHPDDWSAARGKSCSIRGKVSSGNKGEDRRAEGEARRDRRGGRDVTRGSSEKATVVRRSGDVTWSNSTRSSDATAPHAHLTIRPYNTSLSGPTCGIELHLKKNCDFIKVITTGLACLGTSIHI